MKSSKHSSWTSALFRRYLRQCLLWAAGLSVVGGLFDTIIQILPM